MRRLPYLVREVWCDKTIISLPMSHPHLSESTTGAPGVGVTSGMSLALQLCSGASSVTFFMAKRNNNL